MLQIDHAKTSNRRPSMFLRIKHFLRVLQRALSQNAIPQSFTLEGVVSALKQTDFNVIRNEVILKNTYQTRFQTSDGLLGSS